MVIINQQNLVHYYANVVNFIQILNPLPYGMQIYQHKYRS